MEAQALAQRLGITEDSCQLPGIEVVKDVVGNDDVELPALSYELGAVRFPVNNTFYGRRLGCEGECSLIRIDRRHRETESILSRPPHEAPCHITAATSNVQH